MDRRIVGLVAAIIILGGGFVLATSTPRSTASTTELLFSPVTASGNWDVVLFHHAGIVAPTDLPSPVKIHIQGSLPTGEKITSAQLFLDDVDLHATYEVRGNDIIFWDTIEPIVVPNGTHVIRGVVSTNTDTRKVVEVSYATDVTAPLIQINSADPSTLSFSIQDDFLLANDSKINVRSYNLDDGDMHELSTNEMNCTVDTPSNTKQCTMPTNEGENEELALIVNDAAGNQSTHVFGAKTFDELDYAYAEKQANDRKAYNAQHPVGGSNPSGGGALLTSCNAPKIEVFVMHAGNNYDSYGWSIDKKLKYVREALEGYTNSGGYQVDGALDRIDSMFIAKGLAPPQWAPVVYHAVVPLGTNVTPFPELGSQLTILPNLLPPYAPVPCNYTSNIYRTCFEETNVATQLGTATSLLLQPWIKKRSSTNNDSIYEQFYKANSPDVIPIVLVDEITSSQTFPAGYAVSGFSDIEKGTMYVSYRQFLTPVTHFFDHAKMRTTLQHEFGHLMGLGHATGVNELMYAYQSYSDSLSRYVDVARFKAGMCSEGLASNIVGKIWDGGPDETYDTCGDGLLNNLTGNLEECEETFSGYDADGSVYDEPIRNDCALIDLPAGTKIDPAYAVKPGTGTHGEYEALSLYPSAELKRCTKNGLFTNGCKCRAIPPLPPLPPTTTPKKVVWIHDADSHTPTTPPADAPMPAPDPKACRNKSPGWQTDPTAGTFGTTTWACPKDAVCPPDAHGIAQKCAIQGGNCRCIPTAITGCGNGVIDGPFYEECDPPGQPCIGSWTAGNPHGVCTDSCFCAPIIEP